MKKLIPAIAILFVATTGILYFINIKPQRPAPVDTIIVDGEDEAHFEKKKEWFDAMHRTAPGDNWKAMDIEYRHERSNSSKKTGTISGTWSEVGSNNLAGRTHLADYDQETGEVYLLTSGGNIWKGTPGNNDWQSYNDHFQITGAHFFRRISIEGGERWVVATSDWNIQGFLYSDDQGISWNYTTGLENAADWGNLRRAVMILDSGNPVFYVLTMEWDYTNWNKIICVYKSTDLGESFSKVIEYPTPQYGPEAEFDMWTEYEQKNTVYIIENENFGRLDTQDQVVNIGTLPAVSGNTRLTGFDNGTEKRFYVSKTNNSVTAFYASDDGGVTWSAKGSVSEGPFQSNSFAASVINPEILYFGGVNAYRSENSGASWTKVNDWWEYYGNEMTKLHADIPGMCPFEVDGSELLFINTDGGTYISEDYLATVENISMENLRISQYYTTLTYKEDPTVIYAGAQDQGYQRTVAGQSGDNVYNFDQLISGDYGHLVSGDDGASTWCVYPGFAMYYPDAVNSTNRKTWDFVGSGFFWMPQLMEDPYDPTGCYLAGGSTTSGSHIYYLNSNGYSISYEEQDFDFSEGGDAKISAMAYSKANPINRYVLTSEGGFFYSNDYGVNWNKSQGFSGPGTHYFYGNSIIVSENEPLTIYVGGSGYSSCPVFVSYDGGLNFETFNAGLPGTLVFDMVLDDSETILFAATEVGAFACDLTTGEWSDLFEAGVPDQAFWSVEWVNSFARFATYGRGIWDFTPTLAPTAGFLADQNVGCAGMEVSFMDISTGDPQEWLWEFEGGNPETSSLQNPPPVLYENKGSYSVSLTVTNQGGSNTKVMEDYIMVMEIPGAPDQVSAPDSVKLTDLTTDLYTAGSPDALTYNWLIIPEEAGVIDSEEMYAVLHWSEGFIGDAEITVAGYNQCGMGEYSTPKIITRYLNVGIGEEALNAKLYPNPVKNILNYQVDPGAKNISIVNSQGVSLLKIHNTEGTIDVSGFKPGNYFLIYTVGNQNMSARFLKMY
ncbi:MAG: hypothetical protein C0593_00915 [Marinilabiliales bacterium]|nr:MAG: hypothetical protein C0593_00915 [Marinilabiliales bacterium]